MSLLFKVFIFLFVFLFVFDRLTRSYINPYKLIALVGNKGCGKTTYLTKQAILYRLKGFKVYSSFAIPGCYTFDPTNLGKYTFERNSLVIVDEIGLLYHSRNFKTFPQIIRTYLKLQRQYGNTVIIASQSWDFDKSIRDLCDELRLLKNVGRVFTVSRKVSKRLTVVSTKQEEGTETGGLVEDYKFSSILSSGAIDITFIPHWKTYFDTNYMADKTMLYMPSLLVAWNNVNQQCAHFWGFVWFRLHTMLCKLPMLYFKLLALIRG